MTLLIAVTGRGQEKDRQLAFEAGFKLIEEILNNRSIVKRLNT